jgi:RND family efflux transporter MFP subunit
MNIKFALSCLLLAVLGGCATKATGTAAVKPPEVMFVQPISQEVTDFEEFTGRTSATRTIDLRARVSGYLDNVHFTEGAKVEEGELLFTIDDRSYRAQAARAAANVAQLQARRTRLQRQESRASQLYQTKAMSQDEYETTLADVKENAAALAAAIADQEVADLFVSFTKMKSPLTGYISRRFVDPGNLVKADDTLLATIVSTDELYADFDMDERTVLRLQRLIQSGSIKLADDAKIEVQIGLADETDFKHRGNIHFKDTHIDPATGTRRYRAKIDNSQQFFTPGMFVRIRYPIGEKYQALLIPETALASDQGQRYLYLIGKDDKIEYRRVEVGVLSEGRRVIRQGLQPHDKVVVSGLQRIRPNINVTPLPYVSETAQTAESKANSSGITKVKSH